MTTSIVRRFPIVIALDRSEYAEIVLEHALDQAKRHDAPDLHIITVVEDPKLDLEPIKAWLGRLVLEGLDTFRDGQDSWRTRIHVRCGRPAEEITNLAAEISADLIVVGRYGMHHPKRSLAMTVIEQATCPTLVVGLTDHEIEIQPQCRECMKLREESDGERWFCDAHAAPGRMRLSQLLPSGITDSHGGIW
ncbi:MAG TPA: universal stress protein [Kofleriaceae bacterium]|nr:universal stress protein [Kofleriaceae bacterium]